MLNFRKATILFLFVTGPLLILAIFTGFSPWWLSLPVLVYIFLLVMGSAFIGHSFYVEARCKGESLENEIAITFDDGPSIQYTPQILDVLKRQQVPAAFFLIGARLAANHSLVKRMFNEGHVLGNHSYTHHFFFDLFPSSKMLAELKQTNREAEALTGKKMRLFRPPYGVTNPGLAKAIKKGGFQTVGWSLRSMDTLAKNDQSLFEKVLKKLKKGDIVLLHDTSAATASGLENFILNAKKLGYKFVRLDHLLKIDAYA